MQSLSISAYVTDLTHNSTTNSFTSNGAGKSPPLRFGDTFWLNQSLQAGGLPKYIIFWDSFDAFLKVPCSNPYHILLQVSGGKSSCPGTFDPFQSWGFKKSIRSFHAYSWDILKIGRRSTSDSASVVTPWVSHFLAFCGIMEDSSQLSDDKRTILIYRMLSIPNPEHDRHPQFVKTLSNSRSVQENA